MRRPCAIRPAEPHCNRSLFISARRSRIDVMIWRERVVVGGHARWCCCCATGSGAPPGWCRSGLFCARCTRRSAMGGRTTPPPPPGRATAALPTSWPATRSPVDAPGSAEWRCPCRTRRACASCTRRTRAPRAHFPRSRMAAAAAAAEAAAAAAAAAAARRTSKGTSGRTTHRRRRPAARPVARPAAPWRCEATTAAATRAMCVAGAALLRACLCTLAVRSTPAPHVTAVVALSLIGGDCRWCPVKVASLQREGRAVGRGATRTHMPRCNQRGYGRRPSTRRRARPDTAAAIWRPAPRLAGVRLEEP